jgi:hypothetical protein
MKQFSIIVCMLLFALSSHAQWEDDYAVIQGANLQKERTEYRPVDLPRTSYLNISTGHHTMKQEGFPKLKSNYSIGATIGNTYYLHQAPIADCIMIGIDATWLDFNYTNYKIDHVSNLGSNKLSYNQLEAGVQVGPSVTVIPMDDLNISGYFRYAPTFSGLSANDEFSSGFASMFVGGASVAYQFFGAGVEYRFGSCKYNGFSLEEKVKDPEKTKTTLNELRFYVSLRF